MLSFRFLLLGFSFGLLYADEIMDFQQDLNSQQDSYYGFFKDEEDDYEKPVQEHETVIVEEIQEQQETTEKIEQTQLQQSVESLENNITKVLEQLKINEGNTSVSD